MSAWRDERNMDVAMGFGAPEQPVDVSVILPAYNEEASIKGVYRQVLSVLDPLDISYEILFIDDGSTDSTWSLISELAQHDRRLRALRHRTNFGKASALANGFSYARGEIMVTSDADMQYDPHDIVRLIDKVNQGYDVVSAYKVVRRDSLERRLPSKFFNWFVRTMTGVQLHDMNAGLKAFRYDAANDLVQYGYGELHRFFVVLAARRGYRVGEVPVESLPRPAGTSKYGFERYMRGALDFLTVFFLSGYNERPLHFLGGMGLTLFGFSAAIFAYLGVLKAMGQSIGTRPLFSVAILLALGGIQFFIGGLLAEMINNAERGSANRAKIAQVMRVDRRTALMVSPGVRVERRRQPRDPDVAEEQFAVAEGEVVGNGHRMYGRRASDRLQMERRAGDRGGDGDGRAADAEAKAPQSPRIDEDV